jgi:hypothetical protein
MYFVDKIKLIVLVKIELVYRVINSCFPYRGCVMMYHHITDEYVDDMPCCICKVNKFKESVIELSRDHIFISPLELYQKQKEKVALLTFDDSNMDVFVNAYPFLKKNNIPFTVFISNEFIGKDGFVGEKEVKEYAADPLVTIGFHTHSHPFLRGNKRQEWEIMESKSRLEELIGHKIDVFAYPYGKLHAVDVKSISVVRNSGYQLAFGTFNAPLTSFSMFFRFFLPRMI